MRVKDIMTAPAATIGTDALVYTAITTMLNNNMSGLAVVDELGTPCGVISEGDLIRRVEVGTVSEKVHWWSNIISTASAAETYRKAYGRHVRDLMTSPVVSIDADAPLEEAATLFEKHRIKRLPVTRSGDLVGMVTRTDFLKALRSALAPAYEEQMTSDAEIKRRIVDEISRQAWGEECYVTVDVVDGQVVMSGVASTDDHRLAASAAAETVNGVITVENRIVIADPPYMGI